jgi:hypothetical protein
VTKRDLRTDLVTGIRRKLTIVRVKPILNFLIFDAEMFISARY